MKNQKLLDDLEEILIDTVYHQFKIADSEDKLHITRDNARNLIGKIGLRIIHGKDVVDGVILKGKDDKK